jgi:hypothetical protein
MSNGPLNTTAGHVLTLQMGDKAAKYGGSS